MPKAAEGRRGTLPPPWNPSNSAQYAAPAAYCEGFHHLPAAVLCGRHNNTIPWGGAMRRFLLLASCRSRPARRCRPAAAC